MKGSKGTSTLVSRVPTTCWGKGFEGEQRGKGGVKGAKGE